MPRSEDRRGAQRTAAERAAARLEREHRRAARRGEPPPDSPAAAPVDATPPAVLPGPPPAVAPTATPAVAVAEDDRPAEIVEDEAPAEVVEDEAPAEVVDHEEPAKVVEEEALARATDVVQEAAPAPSANGAGGTRRQRRVVRARREGASRAEGHSLRARAGAIAALALVAIAVWGVVMLVRHLRRSGGAPPVLRLAVVKVLVPEGETRSQIAAIARRDGLRGDYLRASIANPGLQPRRFGAPAGTRSLEGFLFPATYEVRAHGSVNELVADQLEAFHERFGPQLERRARALALTSYQLLTVASMVEREALLPHDRPLVAAVIYNRLRLGMPLGIDATIRYALNDFEKPLTEAQLQTPSPYNTRLHTGLPPTPISNPGMEAIEAAAHPAHAAYLFYVDGADGCGELVFSNTEARFEANKAAYDEALRAHGGHLPACKRK